MKGWPVAALLGLAAPVAASVSVALDIGTLERDGIEAREVRLRLFDGQSGGRLELRASEVRLPGGERLRGVRLVCPEYRRDWPRLRCPRAILEAAGTPWGAQRVELDLDWSGTAGWRAGFEALKLAGGRVEGGFEGRGGMLRGRLRLRGVRPAHIPAVRALLRERELEVSGGRLSGRLDFEADAGALRRFEARLGLEDGAWSDAAGEQAGEGVAAQLSVAGRRAADGWRGAVQLRLEGGGVYSDPLYLDLRARPLTLVLDGRLAGGRLELRKGFVEGGPGLRVDAVGDLPVDAPERGSGELRLRADLGALHEDAIAPWLGGTPFEGWRLRGHAELRLALRDGRPEAADLALSEINADRPDGEPGLVGLRGDAHWRATGTAPPSRLRFEALAPGPLAIGGATLRFLAVGQTVHLAEPLALPFHDGTIRVPEATWVGGEAGELGFSLRLEAVSLASLSRALGWPVMAGRVDAEVPRARLRDGSLRVDGTLRIDAFDGTVEVASPRIEGLDSPAPVFLAAVRIRRLDLLALTRTFEFGDMQGRLDGEIRDLRLVNWRPDRFDAHLYSSPDDDRPHRISQRAVEHLTEIGNGVSGALSGGFLGLFESFAYDRIDLKVRLRGDRARIDGLPAPGGGYYLIRGTGIPRIDVIGRNREVAWDDLIARLAGIRVDGVEVR